MGWKSTVKLTREECIEQIRKAIEDENTLNSDLEYALENLVGDETGHNYYIVSKVDVLIQDIEDEQLRALVSLRRQFVDGSHSANQVDEAITKRKTELSIDN